MKIHPTTAYATEVVYGNIRTCKREKQACERHLNDLKRQGTNDFPYVFDESRADRIFQWFEKCCRHVRGAFSGQLIELLDFQKFDLGCKYGWVHKDTGKRRFKKAFNMRGRGNVKSTEKSAETLYAMCGDCVYPPSHPEQRQYENSPEVECAAVDKQQAKRVWLDAMEMAKASPDILKRLNVKRTFIEHKTRGGWLRPLSKDTKNKDGGAPCYVSLDEYHAHPTSEIHDVTYSGFGKRMQSLMDIITTAGLDAENSPAKKEYDICCKILDGEIIAEDYFIMIRELDKEDDPHDESVWIKANPVLQVDNEYSKGLLAQIKSEHDLAYGSGDPAKIREFLIKRCDLWQAETVNKYMSGCMDKWKSLAVPRDEFYRLTKGLDVYAGFDLSKTTDLTAAAFVIPLDDGRIAVTAHGFMPSERATQHEHSDRVPYRFWQNEGWCTITDGAVIEYNNVKTHIFDKELDNEWEIQEFCYDPFNATYFMQDIQRNGNYNEEQFVEVRQGFVSLSLPTQRFRDYVIQGKIVHDGSPLLTWCLSNAVEVHGEGGLIKLSKKHKDDSQRIDLLAAVICAFSRAMVAAEESVYGERGVIVV